MDLDINISDSISVVDSIKRGRVHYGDALFTYGQVNVEYNGEEPSIDIYNSFLVFDEVMISEFVSMGSEGSISISDEALSISEHVEVMLQSDVLAIDGIVLSENFSELNILNTEVIDEFRLTEHVEISNPLCFIDTYDSLGVSEYLNSNLHNNINVFEEIDISEFTKIENIISIHSTDLIDTSEEVTVKNPLCFSFVTDGVNITDRSTVEIRITISKSDALSISEFIIKENRLSISRYDRVHISKHIETSSKSFIFSVDSVNVSENFRPSKTSFVHSSDDIEIREFINIGLVHNVHVVENVSVRDFELIVQSFRFSPELITRIAAGQIKTNLNTPTGGGKVLSGYTSGVSVGTTVGTGKGTL